MKTRRFFFRMILLTIVTAGIVYFLPDSKIPYESNPLDTKNKSKELFQQQAVIPNKPDKKEIYREDTWANQLNEQEVKELNNFVGTSQKITIQPLPNKGYKVNHQGKFRHGLVVQKSHDGSISKYEVGPNGIHDTHQPH